MQSIQKFLRGMGPSASGPSRAALLLGARDNCCGPGLVWVSPRRISAGLPAMSSSVVGSDVKKEMVMPAQMDTGNESANAANMATLLVREMLDAAETMAPSPIPSKNW